MSHYEPSYFDSHETDDVALYQLADDVAEYGERAGWWLVTSSDFQEELAGPFATRAEAQSWIDAL
jgi:hypothetical protein